MIHITAPAAAARIPVDLWENLTFLRCSVNGADPDWFIFDTGATITVLDQELAQRLNLDLSDRRVSARSGQETSWAHGLTLAMPGVELIDQTAAVMPLTDLALFAGRPLAGVFGYELLRQAIVEIDYAGKTLGVHDPSSAAAPRRGERLPLAVVDKWPVIDVRLEQSGLPPVENRIILDSGSLSAVSLMTGGLAAATVELPVSAGITGVGTGSGRIGRLSALRIGPWSLAHPPTAFPPADAPEAPDYLSTAVAATGIGLIGAPVLSRFKITFDYPHDAVWLEPYPGWDRPIEWDKSGAVLMAADDSFQAFRVLGVIEGSAASEAGLLAGDVIVAIAGRPGGDLSLPQVRGLLKQDGASVALTARRGTATKDLTLVLRPII